MRGHILKADSGFTLVELMVAIVLAGMISTFVFAAYTDLFKGLHMQNMRVDRVWQMIGAKKTIGKALGSVETVTLSSPDKLMFIEKGDSLTHTVEFKGNEVYRDGKAIVKNVERFEFAPSEKVTADGERLIKWEGTLKSGGWVGGVLMVSGKE